MRKVILIALPFLMAGAVVTPGPWDLMRGTEKLASFTSESDCVDGARSLNVEQIYTCDTAILIEVTADDPAKPKAIESTVYGGKLDKDLRVVKAATKVGTVAVGTECITRIGSTADGYYPVRFESVKLSAGQSPSGFLVAHCQ